MKIYKPSILLVMRNTSILNNAALTLIVAGYKGQQIQGRTFLMKQSCGNFKPSLVVGLVSKMFFAIDQIQFLVIEGLPLWRHGI